MGHFCYIVTDLARRRRKKFSCVSAVGMPIVLSVYEAAHHYFYYYWFSNANDMLGQKRYPTTAELTSLHLQREKGEVGQKKYTPEDA